MTVEVLNGSKIYFERGEDIFKKGSKQQYTLKTSENSLPFGIDSDFDFSTNTKYSL